MYGFILLFLAGCSVPSVVSLSCDACYGPSCSVESEIVSEKCADDLKICYTQLNRGVVVQAGCGDVDYCEYHDKNDYHFTCSQCKTERCNALVRPGRFGTGGGDAWNSALSYSTQLPLLIFAFFLSLLVVH